MKIYKVQRNSSLLIMTDPLLASCTVTESHGCFEWHIGKGYMRFSVNIDRKHLVITI